MARLDRKCVLQAHYRAAGVPATWLYAPGLSGTTTRAYIEHVAGDGTVTGLRNSDEWGQPPFTVPPQGLRWRFGSESVDVVTRFGPDADPVFIEAGTIYVAQFASRKTGGLMELIWQAGAVVSDFESRGPSTVEIATANESRLIGFPFELVTTPTQTIHVTISALTDFIPERARWCGVESLSVDTSFGAAITGGVNVAQGRVLLRLRWEPAIMNVGALTFEGRLYDVASIEIVDRRRYVVMQCNERVGLVDGA